MRLWRKVMRGCKFLVLRRDGTQPLWQHFVLGARDPAAPAGLRGYANKAEDLGMDPQYVADIREMADEWEQALKQNPPGDPDAAPHRVDDPRIIDMMVKKTGLDGKRSDK